MEDRHYERRLPAAPHSLAQFRRSLRAWTANAVEQPERAADVVLAASELAAATIRGATGPDDEVVLRAWVEDGAVVVESAVDSKAHGSDLATRGSFDGTEGERGFSVIAAIADTFAVTRRPQGVVVRARLPRGRFDDVRSG